MAVWGGVGLWLWCCVGCVRFGCEVWCVFVGGVGDVLGVLLQVFWVDLAPAGCVHACSKWQTSGFSLRAGGTEPVRGSPREAGGTLRRGAIIT